VTSADSDQFESVVLNGPLEVCEVDIRQGFAA
jgi:hypothetical protein